MFSKISKIAIIAAIGLTAVACERIDTGNTGVESVWGQVNEKTLSPGVYQTLTKTIHEVNTREIGTSFNDMRPRTSGNLVLADLDVDIYYQVNSSKAAAIMVKYAGDLAYAEGGYRVGHNFVVRQAREAVYGAASMFEASTMHQKRNEFADAIRLALQASLDTDMGKDWVKVTTVNIRNLVTDQAMESSIQAIAAQELMRKQEVEAQRTLIETNKRLFLEQTGRANADAEKRLIEAKNKAEMQVIEAQAQAQANKLINDSLTTTLLRFREIEMTGRFAEKGATTIFMPSGQNVTPLINMPMTNPIKLSAGN